MKEKNKTKKEKQDEIKAKKAKEAKEAAKKKLEEPVHEKTTEEMLAEGKSLNEIQYEL